MDTKTFQTTVAYGDALKGISAEARALRLSGLMATASVCVAFLVGNYMQDDATQRKAVKDIQKDVKTQLGVETGLREGMISIHATVGHRLFATLTAGHKYADTLNSLRDAESPADMAKGIVDWLATVPYTSKEGEFITSLDRLRAQFGYATGRASDDKTQTTAADKSPAIKAKEAVTKQLSEVIREDEKAVIISAVLEAIPDPRGIIMEAAGRLDVAGIDAAIKALQELRPQIEQRMKAAERHVESPATAPDTTDDKPRRPRSRSGATA